MPVIFLVSIMLLGSASATPATQNLVGCVNRLPNGTLQFGVVPSGQLFVLRDRTNEIEEHVNQLVRVFGESSPDAKNKNSLPTLTVNRVQMLAESCTAAPQGKKSDSVPGKVGEDLVAVPVTNGAKEAKTTPGFQTEASTAQASGSQTAPSRQQAQSPVAPAHADQVAQSEAAGNVNSSAVERTEIRPGDTLGVSTAAGSTENGAQPLTMRPAGEPSETIRISGSKTPQLSPSSVTVKVGQIVEWLNSSGSVQEVIANPARATQQVNTSLPANAQPFDSGFIRQGQSFRYRFTVPGLYRYICKVNTLGNPIPVAGEVIVKP